jgi:hypothetical protein
MQQDLLRNNFQWYAFAADRGELLVIATQASEQTSQNGWGVSPALAPLTTYGFSIYSNPGH